MVSARDDGDHDVRLEPLGDGVIGLRIASDEAPQLDFDTVLALAHAVDVIVARPIGEVRAVVLLGGRRHFTSGAPRALLTGPDAASAIPRLIRAAPGVLFRIPVPTIAAMRGHAIGGGMMFGLWADLAVLSRTSLYAANFVTLGFSPGMGASRRLPELFGPWLAAEMLYSGRAFTGAELAAANPQLAANIVASEQVEARALALAEHIAAADPAAVRATTRLARRVMMAAFEAAVNEEEPLQAELLARPETRATIAESDALARAARGERS